MEIFGTYYKQMKTIKASSKKGFNDNSKFEYKKIFNRFQNADFQIKIRLLPTRDLPKAGLD